MGEQEIRADERGLISAALERAADLAGADDPERAGILRDVASALRTDREELILIGLEAIADEIRSAP